MPTLGVLSVALLLTTSILAQAQDQTVTVGPWTIATSSKAEKFDSCTMSRSTNDLDVSFVRDITACCFYLTRLNGNWSEARRTPLFWLQAHDRLTRRRWLNPRA
jgi:hypothetical protein